MCVLLSSNVMSSRQIVIHKGKIPMKRPGNLGMLVLAIWLILYGVLTAPFLKIGFNHSGDILAVLAIVAGALLIRNR
jgi:hypothetical protein